MKIVYLIRDIITYILSKLVRNISFESEQMINSIRNLLGFASGRHQQSRLCVV